MRYLSIYKTAERATPPTPNEMARMRRAIEDWMKTGRLLAVEGCMPSALGARVRLSGDNIAVTDGPFTDAQELIGGLAILQTHSKAEAIEQAEEFLRFNGVDGECELRQLYDASQSADVQFVEQLSS
jgi:hypothetical protein